MTRSTPRRIAARRGITHRVARTRLQPLFERMLGWSLAGMGIGTAVWKVHESGEAHLVHRAATTWRRRGAAVCLLDVGANEGEYAEVLLDAVGSTGVVHCFEPSSSTFDRLRDAVGTRGAHLHQLALGAVDDTLELHVIPGHSQLSSLHPFSERDDAEIERVPVRRLDDWAAEHGIEHVDLLKVDVEGAELDVLRGASQLLSTGSIDLVQFEFGARNLVAGSSLRDFFDCLRDYDLFRVLPDGITPLGRYRGALELPISATNYLAVRRGTSPP